MNIQERLRSGAEVGLYKTAGEIALKRGSILDLQHVADTTRDGLQNLDLYVHFPFCREICLFCPYHRQVGSPEKRERYVQALEVHIDDALAPFALTQDGKGREITSLLLGGGTPSLLTLGQTQRILEHIQSHSDLTRTEITMELHPNDITEDYINGLQTLGINRLSIGIQNLSDEQRANLYRDLTDADHDIRALQVLNKIGLQYNVDLMFGTPDQDFNSWMKTVRYLAQEIHPPEITTYEYINAYGTATRLRIARGVMERPTLSQTHRMYASAQNFLLESGYVQSGTQTFEREEDFKDQRNRGFMKRNFLGLGPRAYSKIGQWYFINTAKTEDFLNETGKTNEYFGLQLPLVIDKIMDGIEKHSREKNGSNLIDVWSSELATQTYQILCYLLNQVTYPGTKQGKQNN